MDNETQPNPTSSRVCISTLNKLGYFYVTAWSIVEKGYNKNFAAQLLEKWLRYWQWPTKLAIEAPSWCLKFFVVLTLLLPTGVLPKKNSAQMVEKWLKYWQWPTKLAIEAPTWSLKFFVVLTHSCITVRNISVRLGLVNILLLCILAPHEGMRATRLCGWPCGATLQCIKTIL